MHFILRGGIYSFLPPLQGHCCGLSLAHLSSQIPRQHILNISAPSISAVGNPIPPYFHRPLEPLSMILFFLYSTLGGKKEIE